MSGPDNTIAVVRALGVPVGSVDNPEAYGPLPDIWSKFFSQIYGNAMAHDAVSQFIGQTVTLSPETPTPLGPSPRSTP
jgi:hypothetical protein